MVFYIKPCLFILKNYLSILAVPGMTSKPTHPMMESLIEFVHESAPMDSLVKTASKKVMIEKMKGGGG